MQTIYLHDANLASMIGVLFTFVLLSSFAHVVMRIGRTTGTLLLKN